MAGLYVHIPFCATRCSYCGFYSTTKLDLQDRYVDSLCREIALRKEYLSSYSTDSKAANTIIRTIYIGGGTPSQLSRYSLEKLFHAIDTYLECSPEEVTMEVNPDDVTNDLAETISALHINRVSMGAQTFDDNRLKFLNRRHKSFQVERAIDILHEHGVGNISIDLIFGFPGQTCDSWKEDVRRAISLDIQHISAYSLMYEEGTRLYRMLKENMIKEIDEEVSLNMYNELINILCDAGYEHYEISNFAKKGYRAQHNSSYWHDIPYLGIGAAAHSYNIKSRQWNVSDINKYIESISHDTVPFTFKPIDADTHYNDIVTTELRTSEGIDLSRLDDKYMQYIVKQAARHVADKTVVINDGHLKLTREGLYISDMIMSDLMKV
ncbi:MAG: coproporphyrinogen III oxidase [Prevotella sp. AG:487_50_53]|nr:MAG: coproporphyrinogen III oxidase [Prevotella sp. AG:487_50_53]